MSFQKKCEEILKNVDHSSYDSVQGAMESILKMVGQYGTDPYLGTAISKIEGLREEANILKNKADNQPAEKNDENSEKKQEIQEEKHEEKHEENAAPKKDETENKPKQQNLSNESNQDNQSNPTEQTNQTSKCCLLL